MTEPQIAPYGSWQSPITTDLITSRTIGLGQISLDGEDVYWTESRPFEKGRSVVVRRTPDGQTIDITSPPFNVRTRAHEYGGGSFCVADGTIYFSNFADQRLYRQDIGTEPRPITPEAAMRYADGIFDRQRQRIICVCEDHTVGGREAINTLVAIGLEGTEDPQVLIYDNDFYASPRLSPDGTRLAWLTWNHPNMPWDGTELWVGEIKADGSLGQTERVAGGVDESIFQPEWSPDGNLYFVSDRTGWWNLYHWQSRDVPIVEMTAEFGKPQWIFGISTYAFESANRIICTYTQQGIWYLASLDPVTGQLSPIAIPYTDIGSVKAAPGRVVFSASSPTEATAIVQLLEEGGSGSRFGGTGLEDNLSGRQIASQQNPPSSGNQVSLMTVLRRSSELIFAAGYLSLPQPIEFPAADGQTAYALFYPPQNQDYTAPTGEKPPLLVKSHGGPTAAASSSLNFGLQYWTSRGVAVLDVNYGGSTGYGRAYRQRLDGQWGIVDVDDCVYGARYLVEQGLVDGERLAIAGGSAGGYTTLCALTFRDTFKAGASYYGVSDLEALARETHKFESRYLDRLIGPYPQQRQLYQERSPIHFTDRLACPVIFLQGLEDKVVPPNQAETMVEMLRTKGLPVAYVAFAGEQHGFRNAENIKRALEAELFFYSRVFNFELAVPVAPVPIENMTSSYNRS